MNRRRFFLIAFAVLLPLAIFVTAKKAASWRPVKIGKMSVTNAMDGMPSMRASQHEITFGSSPSYLVFDLQKGQTRALIKGNVTINGTGSWNFNPKKRQLVVRLGAANARAYAIPTNDADELNASPPEYIAEYCQVWATNERVELLVDFHYYRWNTASRRLERATICDFGSGENVLEQAVSRDGASIIKMGDRTITRLSTRDGESTHRAALPKGGVSLARLSTWGKYSIYTNSVIGGGSMNWRVVETATAREKWKIQVGSTMIPLVLAPDEQTIAVDRLPVHQWEIRDLKTGALLRTLPMPPNTRTAAFSPDGNTLYSVASGVLYRQRAR